MGTTKDFRILSLDGGGSWALIEVKALMDLFGEAATGHEVLREFDLVVANSGGSIVAAALYKNLPLRLTLGYFMDEAKRRSIFDSAGIFERLANKILSVGPKYSTDGKFQGLTTLLDDEVGLRVAGVAMADLPGLGGAAKLPHVVICGFDYDRTRAVYFRSNTGSASSGTRSPLSSATLAQAVHASSNAPVNYFNEPATFDVGGKRRQYWDGAIGGNNNPTLVGVVEAVAGGTPRESIAVMSIGTGNVFLPLRQDYPDAPDYLTQPTKSNGLLGDVAELATAIVDDPPDAATYIAHVLLGGPVPGGAIGVTDSPVVRFNPMIQPLWNLRTNLGWEEPSSDYKPTFVTLVGLDMDAVENEEVAAIATLADKWLQFPTEVPNQGIRVDGRTFQVEIGHRFYKQARDYWFSICPRRQPGPAKPATAEEATS